MASEELAISLHNISKCFKRYATPVERLKELILPNSSRADEFWALRDISLEVPRGNTIGIVGRNGSGKSTLLQILVGTLTPTTGNVCVNGRISALLELGSGFNPEFTGRQNVFFNGQILGLSKESIQEKFDDIAAFADIGDFIDQPVKTYSSGMYVRLAFSVAINVDPDILVVDEALAVGDARFQQRCMTRINQLRNDGVSILFVSHDSDAVKRLCNHVVVLEKGRIVNSGAALEMTNWYLALMTVDFDMQKLREMEASAKLRDQLSQTSFNQKELTLLTNSVTANISEKSGHEQNSNSTSTQILVVEQVPTKKSEETFSEFKYFRHGDGKAIITRILIRDKTEQEVEFVYLGQTIKVEVEVEFLCELETHLIGIVIRDRLGTEIIGINTYQEQIDMPKAYPGDKIIYSFEFAIHIKPGAYSISPSVAYGQYGGKWLDWIDNAIVMRVIDKELDRCVFGVYLPPERQIKVIKNY